VIIRITDDDGEITERNGDMLDSLYRVIRDGADMTPWATFVGMAATVVLNGECPNDESSKALAVFFRKAMVPIVVRKLVDEAERILK
jgi:hypothetical protein